MLDQNGPCRNEGGSMGGIPSISLGINKEKLRSVINKNYLDFAPEYMTFLTEWLTGTYQAFKDADKYFILVYLFNKNLEFYHDNFIKVDFETFYNSEKIEIEKINIVEIANFLNIPKETARRKINELEKAGVIKKIGKKLVIDKSAFAMVKPTNTIKNFSNVLFVIYNICKQENMININITKNDITNAIKSNFTFAWLHYYKFIFKWVKTWKKFFNNDTEMFLIWGVAVLQRTYKMSKHQKLKLDITDYRNSVEKIETDGINTMSLSEITGIPRPTVTRKLKFLISKEFLAMDKNKLIHVGIGSSRNKEIREIQDNILNNFSELCATMCNQVVISSRSS